MNTNVMGTENVRSLMVRLAIPTVVAQLINMMYNIVDRIYIGHIADVGATALTGVGLCFPVLMLVNAFASLAGAGGAPRAAIEMGSGNDDRAEYIVGNCFSALMGFAVVLTVFFLATATPMLRLFGASDSTLPFALDYMRIYVCGTVFVMIVMGMNPFITTQGFSKFSMLTTVIGAVINIILDPILIFGFGLGVRGAAIATVFSQAVSAVWVLRFLRGKKTILRLRRKHLRLKSRIILPCLALGISSFVMLSTESILNVAFNSSLSRYGGDIAVGAMTIIASVSQFVLMPLSGICQGAQPILSYNYGAGKVKRVREAFFCQFKICVAYTILFCIATMALPQIFAGIFSSDADLIAYTTWAMRIYMAGIFSLGFQISCQQSFMALGQAKVSLLLACLRKIILLIPLIYILPCFVQNQVCGVFLAEPVSDIIAASVTVLVFFRRFPKILADAPAERKAV